MFVDFCLGHIILSHHDKKELYTVDYGPKFVGLFLHLILLPVIKKLQEYFLAEAGDC
jgi:hypothetical protein